MTEQELEILLSKRAKTFDLKKNAFETLNKIFLEHTNDRDFWGSFQQVDIKPIFERFEYHIDRQHRDSVIKTRIGLYIENQNWTDNLEPIGYYELESNLNGEVVDNCFVIEKEKHLKDIEIISHFQSMNNKLPIDYLKRNHIQYQFVSYVSMVGTLFVSKQFKAAALFIRRAYVNLETIGSEQFDKDYLTEAKRFLKIVKDYLVSNNLVTEGIINEIN